jgi:hypothetical protein
MRGLLSCYRSQLVFRRRSLASDDQLFIKLFLCRLLLCSIRSQRLVEVEQQRHRQLWRHRRVSPSGRADLPTASDIHQPVLPSLVVLCHGMKSLPAHPSAPALRPSRGSGLSPATRPRPVLGPAPVFCAESPPATIPPADALAPPAPLVVSLFPRIKSPFSPLLLPPRFSAWDLESLPGYHSRRCLAPVPYWRRPRLFHHPRLCRRLRWSASKAVLRENAKRGMPVPAAASCLTRVSPRCRENATAVAKTRHRCSVFATFFGRDVHFLARKRDAFCERSGNNVHSKALVRIRNRTTPVVQSRNRENQCR